MDFKDTPSLRASTEPTPLLEGLAIWSEAHEHHAYSPLCRYALKEQDSIFNKDVHLNRGVLSELPERTNKKAEDFKSCNEYNDYLTEIQVINEAFLVAQLLSGDTENLPSSQDCSQQPVKQLLHKVSGSVQDQCSCESADVKPNDLAPVPKEMPEGQNIDSVKPT